MIGDQGPGNNTPVGYTAPPAGPGPSADQTDAFAMVKKFLDGYGLGSLATWVWDKILNNESEAQIMLELRDTAEYKARFPAMEELAKSGRGITEAEYRSYEQTVYQVVQQWGLPKGMYDTPLAIAKMLTGNVSAAEVNQRAQLAAAAAFTAPEEVRTGLARMGGTGGDLIAYYLDSSKALPILQQQFNAAQVIGAGLMQDVNVSNERALQYAQQGVTFDQAQSGLAAVRGARGLTTGFGETVTEEQLADAQFGDAQAQQTQQRVQRGRLARGAGGGSLAEASTGVVGLGRSSG